MTFLVLTTGELGMTNLDSIPPKGKIVFYEETDLPLVFQTVGKVIDVVRISSKTLI